MDGKSPNLVGPPAIGKSTLALAVLHHPDIIKHFGERRYFLDCKGITEPNEIRTIVMRIARDTGIELLDVQAFRAVAKFFAEAPSIVVLDNIDRVLGAHPTGTTQYIEALMNYKIPFITTSRLQIIPTGALGRWVHTYEVCPLDEAASLALLTDQVVTQSEAQPLQQLSKLLGGHPLVILTVAEYLRRGRTAADARDRYITLGPEGFSTLNKNLRVEFELFSTIRGMSEYTFHLLRIIASLRRPFISQARISQDRRFHTMTMASLVTASLVQWVDISGHTYYYIALPLAVLFGQPGGPIGAQDPESTRSLALTYIETILLRVSKKNTAATECDLFTFHETPVNDIDNALGVFEWVLDDLVKQPDPHLEQAIKSAALTLKESCLSEDFPNVSQEDVFNFCQRVRSPLLDVSTSP